MIEHFYLNTEGQLELDRSGVSRFSNDRTLLPEYEGTIRLGYKWCESVFKRMKWTKRKGTTSKPIIRPGLVKEVGLTFFKDIAEVVQADAIPPELIINIDQTPLPFLLISKYSMNKKGTKMSPFRELTIIAKSPVRFRFQ